MIVCPIMGWHPLQGVLCLEYTVIVTLYWQMGDLFMKTKSNEQTKLNL